MPPEPQTALDMLRREDGQQQQRRQLEAHTTAVREARDEVETSLRKLQEVSARLRQFVRRAPSDEGSSQITAFANAHLRLTAALGSGIRRTASMDRLIDAAEAERQEAQRQVAQREERRERAQAERRLQLPEPEDAFEELYGEMIDAD